MKTAAKQEKNKSLRFLTIFKSLQKGYQEALPLTNGANIFISMNQKSIQFTELHRFQQLGKQTKHLMKGTSKCTKVGVNSKKELKKSLGFGESLDGKQT